MKALPPVFIKFFRAMSDKPKFHQTANSSNWHTSEIADLYRKYRPEYGSDIFDTIIRFCKETSDCLSLAIDAGCGSGQSAVPLTRHFKTVIGLDSSRAQISKAPTHISNLSFRVGPAEDLSFADEDSVDLVSVAQAMHWMDTQRLYPQVQRVLKPGGAFVAYGYGLPVLDQARAQEVIDHFYTNVLCPYWRDGRNHVREHYQTYSLPFPGWQRNDNLKIKRSLTVDELVGYLRSSSGYQTCLRDNPTDDTMAAARQRWQQVYQNDKGQESEGKIKVTWPVFMLMAHKPGH